MKENQAPKEDERPGMKKEDAPHRKVPNPERETGKGGEGH